MIRADYQISMSSQIVKTVTALARPVSLLIDLYQALLNPTSTSDDRATVDIPLGDFLRLTGHYGKQVNTRFVNKCIHALREVTIDNGETSLFESVARDVDIKASKVLRIKCSEAAEPQFFGLGKGAQYYSFRLGEVIGLSAQAYALFLLMKQKVFMRKELTAHKDDVMTALHLSGSAPHYLIERVCAAVSEINANTHYNIDIQLNKANQKLLSFTFLVDTNEHWIARKHIRDDWEYGIHEEVRRCRSKVDPEIDEMFSGDELRHLTQLSRDYLLAECCHQHDPSDADIRAFLRERISDAKKQNAHHLYSFILAVLHKSILRVTISDGAASAKKQNQSDYQQHGTLSPMMRQAIQDALGIESDMEPDI